MYTQILKEILPTIDFEQIHFDEFLTYARQELADNTKELKNVDKIEKEYHLHQPIWWYTYQSFLYSMVNRALRTMEVDLIVKMVFFVRDLHQHITELHTEQNYSNTFILYRGQGLCQAEFDQLRTTHGGLLYFNSFLSTSRNRDVPLSFARRIVSISDLVSVLFVMKIDPSIQTTPFANVKSVSFYQKEEEILFSMHSVFRMGQVKQLDGDNRLWQVNLILTSDKDPQLHALTERMQEKTYSRCGRWGRLGKLMIKLGQLNKAEELYDILFKQTSDEREKSVLFDQLGWIRNGQGNYAGAVESFEKSIKINERILSSTDPDLVTSYNKHWSGV